MADNGNREKWKTRAKLWGVLLLILFFLATVAVLTTDHDLLGAVMSVISLAIIGGLICKSVISAKKEAKRRSRYGISPYNTLSSVSLPEEFSRLELAMRMERMMFWIGSLLLSLR